MRRGSRLRRAFTSCALVLGFFGTASAQSEGAAILIGMSTPLTGANAAYGQGLRAGVQLAVNRLNEGASAKKVELRVLDDGGDPTRAAANTRSLLAAGAVLFTGYHGTRSVQAAMPLLDAADIPMVGVAASDESLREPPRRLLFHLRAGAREEMSAIVLQLDTLALTRFAVIAQDDGLGESAAEQLTIELVRIAMRPLRSETVKSRDGAAGVAAALRAVCQAQPQAIILALDAPLALETLGLAKAQDCKAQFVVMSETGAALQRQSPDTLKLIAGLMVAQVVPHPSNLSHPLVAEYVQALHVAGVADRSYPSLEGYLYGRVVTDVLRQCTKSASRNCILQALQARVIEVPGVRVNFTGGQRRGYAFVELTMLDAAGRFRR